MNHLGISLVGVGVTLIVASALALLVWGAILDGREEARQRELRRHRSDVHPIDGPVPTRAARHERSTQVKRTVTTLVAAVLAASLLVGAATARPTAAPATKVGEQLNIVQTAVAAGKFKTLAKLLTRAGLLSALEEPGPFTVFAPTDAAFQKLPEKTLTALLRNKAKLKAVLLYHVVSGKVTAADVVKLSSAKTLNGKDVRIRVSGANVFVDSAKVTTPDVMASNGVIHVVSRVLIPPAR
jgi:uncharacterized surface protein with fasciclin (FAS1) repeats